MGKTRVLSSTTVNAIIFQNTPPDRIYLTTFTVKAAKQLKDELQTILGRVTNITGTPFYISRMYVGMVHTLCKNIIGD
ncbi:UvrD-helicase domain-containing protein [Saliterribacillus persicus]|uniref:UvrD-helicase domain-containing protein n=1 Tax=Saliterribacillus persicus TaxID=930114 RepID=UPI001FEAB7EF|nr:UvrD-helicase domain-containing protein [Saliterribacillus persicus]